MRPGIVDLRDLASRHAWQPRERTHIGAADATTTDLQILAIPGTRNVLLVASDRVRVI